MRKFRKRPIIVEAEQWFPDRDIPGVSLYTPPDVVIFDKSGQGCGTVYPQPAYHVVQTIHGEFARLEPGDWVIREPDGIHYYPCKPDLFTVIYEEVTDES